MCTQLAESLPTKFAGDAAGVRELSRLGRDSGTRAEYIRHKWKMEHESDTREVKGKRGKERNERKRTSYVYYALRRNVLECVCR